MELIEPTSSDYEKYAIYIITCSLAASNDGKDKRKHESS